MNDRKHDNTDQSLQSDFLEIRSKKRELLGEMSLAWQEGRSLLAEDVLSRWPSDKSNDPDVASVLFEEYQQRRAQGDEKSLADIEDRFPEQRNSLASLMRGHDVFRSVSGSHQSCPRLSLPSVGDELFGFRMRHELGRGAFACVFMAEQAHLADRPVVLKVSALEGNEPQTLAQLQHTHIVPIYSVHDDATASMRAVCMPYFGGASLSAVLHALWPETPKPTTGEQLVRALESVQAPSFSRERSASAEPSALAERSRLSGSGHDDSPLTWLRASSYYRAAARIIADLAKGLDHAHERGIFHRDIKPANILLASDGTAMLLDFNLAEDMNSAKARASATLGGTISYMAPEHLRALAGRSPALIRKVDHRSDIYSLGMVLYEMLVGQSPFRQSASYSPIPMMIEAMAIERSEMIPSLRRKRQDAPWDLESIIRKCLDPDQQHRYQRASQVAEDLEAYLTDQPLRHAPQLSKTDRCRKWMRRHPRLTSSGTVGTVAAVLLITVAAALFSASSHLRSAQTQNEVHTARDKLRRFDAGTLRALCLVNVADTLDENLRKGAEMCEQTLNIFGVLDRPNWVDDPEWQHMNPEERRDRAENTRELLVVLAWARVQGAPKDPTVLRDALTLLDRAEAVPGLEPTPALFADRATYLEKLGDREAAAAARQRAATLPPTTARDYYLLASTHIRRGGADGFARGLEALDNALRLNQRHYWSWVQRGLIRLDRREYTLAAADFGVCIGLEPDFVWGYFNRAYAFEQGGNKEAALADYTAAIQRDPGFAMAYHNRAALLLEQGKHAEALADLDRALALGRDEPTAHAARAMALEALKRYAESEEALAKALAKASTAVVRPGAESPQVRIRWTYGFAISARLPEKARELFEEVLERNPQHPQALYGLAMLETTAGHLARALAYFNQAIEADPNFVHARRFRAVALARAKCFAEAQQDINWCLEREPTSGPTLYAAACVAARIAEATDATNKPAAAQARAAAFDFLKRSFDQTYGPGRVDDDPDLAPLHNHPGFERFRKSPLQKRGLTP